MNLKHLFLLGLIFFFTACIQEIEENSVVTAVKGQNDFIGIWESVDRLIPYHGVLTINEDSAYYFEYGACLSHGFSKGKWALNDGVITLQSEQTDSCMYLLPFEQDCILVDESDTAKQSYPKTIPDCAERYLNNYIEFNAEAFFIQNDTLIHITKNPKLCPELKEDFTRIPADTIPS